MSPGVRDATRFPHEGRSKVYKKWIAILFAMFLVFAPMTAQARGFGSHFSSRSGYSHSFGGGSKGFSFRSGSSSHGLGGLFGGSTHSYSSYHGSLFGSHLGSFGLGMLFGGMMHPFGGYYGMGSMYGYHGFGLGHIILDLIVLYIIFRIIRGRFRR